MKLKKRVLAGCLAVILGLSSSITTFATNSGGNGGEQDSGASKPTGTGGNGTWNLPSNTGFRFTICDSNGIPVSNILGDNNIKSLDVIHSGVKNSGEIWTGCATENTDNKDIHKYFMMPMSSFLSGIQESGHNLIYADNSDATYGNDVKAFILKGNISGGSGGSGGLDTSSTEWLLKAREILRTEGTDAFIKWWEGNSNGAEVAITYETVSLLISSFGKNIISLLQSSTALR